MRQHNGNGHLGKSGGATLLSRGRGARASGAMERCSCTPECENRVTPLPPAPPGQAAPTLWGSARLPCSVHTQRHASDCTVPWSSKVRCAVTPRRPTAGQNPSCTLLCSPCPPTRPLSSTYTSLHPPNTAPPASQLTQSNSSSSIAPLQHCEGSFCHPVLPSRCSISSVPPVLQSPGCSSFPGASGFSTTSLAPCPRCPHADGTAHISEQCHRPAPHAPRHPGLQYPGEAASILGQRGLSPKPAWLLCRMRPAQARAHSSPHTLLAHQRSMPGCCTQG